MKILSILLCVTLAVLAIPSHANEARIQACIAQAATTFDIDIVAMQVLREIEGGQEGTVSSNDNGTVDLGPMQINSRWKSTLDKVGVSLESVRDNACVNAMVAAWIFKQELRATGNTIQAMARYHSPTPYYQARYLARALQIVQRQREAATPLQPVASVTLESKR